MIVKVGERHARLILFACRRTIQRVSEPRRLDDRAPSTCRTEKPNYNYDNFPVINRKLSYLAGMNVRVRFIGMPLEMRICARVSLFDRTRNDKCTCMRHTYTPYSSRTYYRRVALCERSKRPTNQPANRPTDRPTGFIITRWHRAIRANRSLTSVEHVGIIARTRGSFNISISALASYYPRKSRRGPARAPA